MSEGLLLVWINQFVGWKEDKSKWTPFSNKTPLQIRLFIEGAL